MATLSISSMSILTGSRNNNNCVLPIVDSISNTNNKVKITAHNLFYSNNTTVGSLSSYNNYFGTGIDGDCTISSSAQISSSTSPAGLNNISREYGDTIVKNFQNLTINSGIVFTPLRACRGMVIYCTGNLTINGTVSMTGKGGGVATKIASPIGIASSTDSRFDLVDATLYFNNLSSSAAGGRGIPTHWNWAPSGSAWFSNFKVRVPLSGSVAGGAAPGSSGPAGVFCGGGGGGGGAAGGRGTIFAGGGGSGGASALATTDPRFDVATVGGTTPGGPSGGNGGGSGGLIILIVRGNITINGTVSVNGISGTEGGGGYGSYSRSGGGGGGGGGIIVIIYGGTYTNVGSIVASGGSAGGQGAPGGPGGSYGPGGGAGGAGSTTVKKVHV